jgi:hypothetical protein
VYHDAGRVLLGGVFPLALLDDDKPSSRHMFAVCVYSDGWMFLRRQMQCVPLSVVCFRA